MSIPCDMLVFGGTGDLALHKLLPALYHLHREGRLHDLVLLGHDVAAVRSRMQAFGLTDAVGD